MTFIFIDQEMILLAGQFLTLSLQIRKLLYHGDQHIFFLFVVSSHDSLESNLESMALI